MGKNPTQYNAASLIEELDKEGLIDRPMVEGFLKQENIEVDLPVYLRILAAIGALISAVFFYGFLAAAGLIDLNSEVQLFIWGLVLVAIAIVMSKKTSNQNTAFQSFLAQSSFVTMVLGKGLFVFGFTKLMDSGWGASLGLLVITTLTYPIYKVSIDRFLSVFCLLVSTSSNLMPLSEPANFHPVLMNSFFFLQYITAAFLITSSKVKSYFNPISYALVFAICCNVYFSVALSLEQIHNPVVFKIVLTLGLVAMIGGLFRLWLWQVVFCCWLGSNISSIKNGII